MLNRHAQAGFVALLLMVHDGTCEILHKPIRVRLFCQQAAAIEDYLRLRQNPNCALNPASDFLYLQNRLTDYEPTRYRYEALQSNDLICRHSKTNTVFFVRVLFDDYQPKKNYRVNQREKHTRKFLRAYASVSSYYKRTQDENLRPLLCILSNARHEISAYLPQSNIYYGELFCEEFFPSIRYQKVDTYLRELGDDPAIVQIFDDLYEKIRHGSLGKQLPEANPIISDDV